MPLRQTVLITSLVALTAVTFAVFQPGLLAADPAFADRHTRDIAGNPSDLHFHLSTEQNRHTFRVGERISLVLTFSSDTPDKYTLDAATYDRSGRLMTEEFHADRTGLTDPLLDYLGAGVLGGIAGGLRSMPVLSSSPETVALNLNDWVRFDRPGHYRFYLRSHRIRAGALQIAPVSNIIDIEITEDLAWSAAKVAELRAVLDLAEPSDTQGVARLELGYLGTQAAVELAFEDARTPRQSPPDWRILVSARNRAEMLAAFDRHLARPDVAITEWDLRLRAFFRYLRQEGASLRPLPVFPWQYPADDAEWRKVQAEAERRQQQFAQVLRAEAAFWIPATAKKNPDAREGSAEAIGSVAPEAARAAGLIPPEIHDLPRDQLIHRFPELSEKDQSELLSASGWDLIGGPDVVPALVAVIRQARPATLPGAGPGAMGLHVWGTTRGVAEEALRRLHEVAPDKAAEIIRQDIASGHPAFPGYAVREFPAQDIQEADAALSSLLKSSFAAGVTLAAHFGTRQLAPEMRALYGAQKRPSCNIEQDFVTYFVRVFPSRDGEGRAVLRAAMRDREKRGCYRSLLGQVALVAWNPAIEAEVLAALSPAELDPEVAATAARVLADRGDAGNGEKATHPVVSVSSGGSMFPAAFRVDGSSARTMARLKEKMLQYPLQTVFSWCAEKSGFEHFSDGQKQAMFEELSNWLASRGMELKTGSCQRP